MNVLTTTTSQQNDSTLTLLRSNVTNLAAALLGSVLFGLTSAKIQIYLELSAGWSFVRAGSCPRTPATDR